ncbi:MAG: CopD family protein [Methylacidiphilales bacterium]|nr:CopD family protein [Candidatus Methylacidiphilales bacterium]
MTITTLLVLARSVHFAGALLLFALPFFAGWTLRPALAGKAAETSGGCGRFGRALMKWFWAALFLEALSGAAWFWLVTVQMSGAELWNVPGSDDLGAVLWQTQFGQLWLDRAAALAVLFALTAFAQRGGFFFFFGKSSFWNVLILALSGTLLVSLAWAGHAAAGIYDHNAHLLADMLHLLLGAVWPMGLLPFALFLRHADRTGRTLSRELAVMQRFSQTSFAAVFILVATGLVNTWLMIGSWSGLFDTVYGRLLLAKVAAVGLMIGLGAYNRCIWLPGLAVAPEDAMRYLGLRRNVVAEAVLAGVVLLIVGILGITPPPS